MALMDAPSATVNMSNADLAGAAKAIKDLDALVTGVLKTLPTSNPWQRQTLSQLHVVDRHIEVLRLTIALERATSEVAHAALEIQTAMRSAEAFVQGSRADIHTKAALQLAAKLAERVVKLLTSQP